MKRNIIIQDEKEKVLIEELEKRLKDTTRSTTNYQSVDIYDGNVTLESHTLKKYMFAKEILDNNNIKSAIDYGCCFGGIGLCIAQNYPNVQVSMTNIDDYEVNTCKDFIQCSRLKNINVTKENVIHSQNSYDLTMYFALLHHVLKNTTISDIIDMIYFRQRQVH